MVIDDKIRDEKLLYNIYREVANISAISSSKADKYEYLTGENILPSNQRQIIDQAKFAYSPFRESFQKTNKKQVSAIKSRNFSNKKMN